MGSEGEVTKGLGYDVEKKNKFLSNPISFKGWGRKFDSRAKDGGLKKNFHSLNMELDLRRGLQRDVVYLG